MNHLILFLALFSTAFSQVSGVSFPTEGSSAVPQKVKPQKSDFEEVVNEADSDMISGTEDNKDSKSEVSSKSTREIREASIGTAMLGYQFITSWLPSKMVLGYSHIFNEKWSLEGEYSWSSINDPFFWVDVGEVREKRLNLQALRYVGNSFHFTFGAVFSQFRARLGNDFFGAFGQELTSSFDAHNIGVTGGIGNRWMWSNGITVGIDWIRLNVPVYETYVRDDVVDAISDDDEQEEIKDIIRTFNRIPTFVLFGLKLGYSF